MTERKGSVALRDSGPGEAVASFNSLASQRGVRMASLSLRMDKRGPCRVSAGRLSSCTRCEGPVRCRDTRVKNERDWSYGSGR
jgi:hypothetical protein